MIRLDRNLLIRGLVLANVILWIIPSNVVELVAREQQVLCGRYSRTHFAWMLVLFVTTLVVIYILWPEAERSRRRRFFQIMASCLALAPTLLLADAAIRLRTDYPYVSDPFVYHRPPHAHYHLPYVDRPEARRNYPTTPPGFGRVDCVMTYDRLGFRNGADSDHCDIVALGDSFTEGSRVSDDQPWPVQLAKLSGLSVRNLGISGYSPQEYLASLKAYGLPAKPRIVLCMLYEGNDFHESEVRVRSGISVKQFIMTSPLLRGMDTLLVDTFGPIGAARPFSGQEVLSWLPVPVPRGPDARFYAFAPKQILDLYISRDDFEMNGAWVITTGVLREMQRLCGEIGARLAIVYAPAKAHVVFPLAAGDLPAEKVRAFVSLRTKKNLPPATELMAGILGQLDNQESVIREWCERHSIAFISLTKPLRDEAARGRQGYYTYDQHWTPFGHACAAHALNDFVASAPRTAAAPPPSIP